MISLKSSKNLEYLTADLNCFAVLYSVCLALLSGVAQSDFQKICLSLVLQPNIPFEPVASSK